MRLLYVAAYVNSEGGVQKVLSDKTNYFIDKFGYEIAVLTCNEGVLAPFFEFNNQITFFNQQIEGNKVLKLYRYKRFVQQTIKSFQPDVVVVCDFGLKSFSLPFMIHTKIPLIFEAHGSLYNESQEFKSNVWNDFFHGLKYKYRKICAKKFDCFIVLSHESLLEWNVENAVVIPNPIVMKTQETASLNSKKIIVVARHSFEKGLDRLISIWRRVSEKNIDWTLHVFGEKTEIIDLEKVIVENNSKNIFLHNPVKDIESEYLKSSIYAMTSRSEGFPLVLLEAMSKGLPVISYDCPVGPRALIEDEKQGFLIPDGDEDLFVEKMEVLMNDIDLRIKMGKEGVQKVQQFQIESVMSLWKDLFLKLH